MKKYIVSIGLLTFALHSYASSSITMTFVNHSTDTSLYFEQPGSFACVSGYDSLYDAIPPNKTSNPSTIYRDTTAGLECAGLAGADPQNSTFDFTYKYNQNAWCTFTATAYNTNQGSNWDTPYIRSTNGYIHCTITNTGNDSYTIDVYPYID